MSKIPTILFFVVVAILVLVASASEILDWIGRFEIIEKRWPRVWTAMNSRPLRLLFYAIFIVLIAEDIRERLGEAKEVTPFVAHFAAPSPPAITVAQIQPASAPVPVPEPTFADLQIVSQRPVVSTRADAKFCLETTVITKKEISPVAFVFHFSGPIKDASVFTVQTGAYYMQVAGKVYGHPDRYVAEWRDPSFVPEIPMTIKVFSSSYVKLTNIEQIEYGFPAYQVGGAIVVPIITPKPGEKP